MGEVNETVVIKFKNIVEGQKELISLRQQYELLRRSAENIRSRGEKIGVGSKAVINDIRSQINAKRLNIAQDKFDMVQARESAKQLENQRIANLGFLGTLKLGQPAWANFNKENNKFNNVGGKLANSIRMLTHGLRGFRMELLGVMFFGMFVGKMFMDMLQPALQLTGVFELISTTLSILFLPIALVLLEVLLPILDVFMTLPDGVKLVIGGFVLFIGVILLVAGFIAQLLLGIGSLIMFLAGLGAGSGTVAGVLTLLGGVVSGVVASAFALLSAAILPVIIILGLLLIAFLNNKDGILNALGNLVQGFMNGINGILDILTGFIDFLVGIFTGDTDKALKGIEKMFRGVVAVIKAIFLDIPVALADVGLNILKGIAKGIINAYGVIRNAIAGIPIIGPIIAGGMDIVSSIGGTVWSGIKGLLASISNLIPKFASGGIVTRPTLAMVGEAGPEAIVPLGQSGGFAPNITINISASTAMGVTAEDIASVVESRLGSELRRLSLR